MPVALIDSFFTSDMSCVMSSIDQSPIWCSRHLRQPQRCRSQDGCAKDPSSARRKRRSHTENVWCVHCLRTLIVPLSVLIRRICARIQSGKATFFVANQNSADALPEHKVKALAEETEALTEGNRALTAEVKAASAGVYCQGG
jgi:hypothetical protein